MKAVLKAGILVGLVSLLALVVPGEAGAHDVGATIRVVHITTIPNAPNYICTYGENHLWESNATTVTMAAGTTSRSAALCANITVTGVVATSVQLVHWNAGTPSVCFGPWGGNASNVSAYDPGWLTFPINSPPCGAGTYSLTSAHNLWSASIPGWEGGGFLSSGFHNF